MFMDENAAVQMKILRLVMLADNFCTRVGHGVDLHPSEALAYKQTLDYIRQHTRLMELYTIQSVHKLEGEIYGPQPQPEQRDESPGRVAERPDRQTNPRPRQPEEDEGLGDSPGGVPSGSPD
jgi:hypothetical protein